MAVTEEHHCLNDLEKNKQISSANSNLSPLAEQKFFGWKKKELIALLIFLCINLIAGVLNGIGLSTETKSATPTEFMVKVGSSTKDIKTQGGSFTRSCINVTDMETSQGLDLRLKSPFTAIISGPTGSGKTRLLQKIIDKRLEICDEQPEEIIYCYGSYQDSFSQMKNITFREGLINPVDDIPDDNKARWLIIDDLMEEAGKSTDMLNLFTKHSHHKNISVWFVTQNLYHKNLRGITLNAQYIILFKNPRDKAQIFHLGRQLYPSSPKFLVECYEDATAAPYSYLWLDLKQSTDESVRVLGNVLADKPDLPIAAYTPK